MGRLTTHVLDTALGRPGAGIAVTLYRVKPSGGREKLGGYTTNDDGRCDRPLLEGAAFTVGIYELVFEAGAYFERTGQSQGMAEPKFLDHVTIRFGIAVPKQHYHVPLLLSPYAYSTYRGS
ncbi:hydroxyisourate hydrolase [Dongia deserti]|uniref:hydroxyisourate hydrolase n=1 Tax=Dongia deserti TaxID=2268030 RepID=UPI000E65027B|nr:hydroxyisourate hydrolase [Dongia deserti]